MIVGRFGSGSDIPLPTPGVPPGRAFVWDSNLGRTDLGLQPFGFSQAVAINDAGLVTGTSEVLEIEIVGGTPVANLVGIHPFVWDAANGIRDLGTLGGNSAFAEDINELGQVVGRSENEAGFTRAFVWDEAGGIKELPTLGRSSQAVAINDLGQVLGFDFGTGAVIWDLQTGTRHKSTGGIDMNNWGQILGGFINDPTIFDPGNGIMHLNDLIPGDSPWRLEIPFAINEASSIVGYGQLNGETTGFLLVPVPEPNSLLLLMSAGTFLAVFYTSRPFLDG